MAQFKMNFRGNYLSTSIACLYCMVQPDSQEHSTQCAEIVKKIIIMWDYMDIFNEDIPENMSKTLLKISNIRKDIL